MKQILTLFTFVTLLTLPLFGVPGRGQGQGVRELHQKVEELRYELMNQEMQLNTFQEKFENQEEIAESLAQMIDEEQRSNRERLKGNASGLDSKLHSIEKLLTGLREDLHTLQAHANQTTDVLKKTQKRLGELEQTKSRQDSDIENMKAAVTAMMDALGVESKEQTYTVRYGDTLGKIAHHNKISIKTLKEINQLNNDNIREGQKLKLP